MFRYVSIWPGIDTAPLDRTATGTFSVLHISQSRWYAPVASWTIASGTVASIIIWTTTSLAALLFSSVASPSDSRYAASSCLMPVSVMKRSLA